ncbi:hypothetical protein WJX72_009468 [[Myrmecia] bisecta]|uniref:Protein kinase domain-containing protein n=1 Tax=[Myrmecia] bisecta TaxID=41462 RepID=A0AAW1PXJ5_9CHLO
MASSFSTEQEFRTSMTNSTSTAAQAIRERIPAEDRTFRMRRLLEADQLMDEAWDLVASFAEDERRRYLRKAYEAACKAVDLAALNEDEMLGSLACYQAAELMLDGATGQDFQRAGLDRFIKQAARYDSILRTYEMDFDDSAARQANAVQAKYRRYVAGQPGKAGLEAHTCSNCRRRGEPTYTLAAKVLSYAKQGGRAVIMKEVSIMKRLARLPHIVRLLDAAFDEDNKLAYLILERLHGCTLAQLSGLAWWASLDTGRWEAVLRELALQIFQTLLLLHKRGIAHCDLKGDNIFVTAAAQRAPPTLLQRAQPAFLDVKLIDFGLAELHKPGQRIPLATGTPSFMPPEVVAACLAAWNRREAVLVDPAAADMYSAGLALYEALAGAPAFASDNAFKRGQMEEVHRMQEQNFFQQARLTARQALRHPFLAKWPCQTVLPPEAVLAGFGGVQ